MRYFNSHPTKNETVAMQCESVSQCDEIGCDLVSSFMTLAFILLDEKLIVSVA